MKVDDYPTELLKNLRHQAVQEKFCDIEVVVDDQVFHGHKIILSSASSQLQALIESTDEKHSTTKSKLQLSGISAVGFGALFDFMYSGEINLNDTNIHDVSMSAMVLGVHSALEACTMFQRQKLTACNLASKSFAIASTEKSKDLSQCSASEKSFCQLNEAKQEVIEVSNDALSPESSELQISPPPVSRSPSFSDSSMPKDSSGITMQLFGQPGQTEPQISSSFSLGADSEPLDQSNNDQQLETDADQSVVDAYPSLPLIDDSIDFEYTKERDSTGVVWRCKHCQKTFRTLSYLKNNHIPLHTGTKYWCKHCKRPFSTKTSLHNHVKLHLAKQGFEPFKCRICQKSFASLKLCQQHQNTHFNNT